MIWLLRVFKPPPALERTLGEVVTALHRVERRLIAMAGELDGLKLAVERNTAVDASAIALLQGIKAKLDAAIAAGDPAALTALSSELGSSTDALAAAVVANTPAEP